MPVPDVTPPSPIADKVAALRTEAGLATILDGIGEGFYAVDRDWRIVLFNSEAARHFRCAPQDVLGRILWEAFPGTRDTALGEMYFKVMANRETIRSETESIVFKGRWMAYRLFPLGDGLGVVFRDTTDRRNAEEQRDLLIRELEHRVKNTIAIVQSIASQTFRHGGVDPEVQRAFEQRLITLSDVHGILTQQNWDSAGLHQVVRAALRPHDAPESPRITIGGPEIRLSPQSAVAFSLAVHELATNAVKYGALSVPAGRVDLTWDMHASRFQWRWHERGGPLVTEPTRTGFGSRMIERALALQLAGQIKLDYAPAGLVCTIDAPLEAVRDAKSA